jgi:aminoglycoside phosphotransferase (APT) family kinase protein
VSDDVAPAAEALLGVRVTNLRRIERGFGNENWRATTPDGDVVVKVGLADTDAAKWTASTRAQSLAAAAGVPVPNMLAFTPACDALGGRVVRIIEFVDGVHPEAVLADPAVARAFFADFGAVLGRLHAVPWHAFSSRLDGSAPEFATWAEYVEYRLPQIEARGADLLAPGEFAYIAAIVRETVAAVSAVVTPSLTHRDLYFDNLLVRPDGHLVAVLDWDGAEAWDPAIDLVKPRCQMFPVARADAVEAFWAAYPALERLEERLVVVDLLEQANAVANARIMGNQEYEHRCRRWLGQALRRA